MFCNSLLCPTELIEEGNILVCPECQSKYQLVFMEGCWILKELVRGLRLLEKMQIRNLQVIEGIVKKL